MDVALIQWPSDESLRAHLAQEGHPRLLLVDPEADPPVCVDVLEDWVRLPVSRDDRNARVRSLLQRAGRLQGDRPVVSDNGTLEYVGATVELSATHLRLVAPLIERFGAVVSREELAARTWPGVDAGSNNLDVTISRLRGRVDRVGLRVRTVRSRGYLLCPNKSRR
jgi:DNA-binding response OmpR family regulator